jgi:hypothetical protein
MSYEFSCTFVRETDNAVLVHDHASEEDVWIPLSQVESMHKDRNDSGSIVVSDWIARQKGLLR